MSNTFKIEIELPRVLEVTSRGVTVPVDMTKLSATMIATGATHGITQKVSDTASGARNAAFFADNPKADAAKTKASVIAEWANANESAIKAVTESMMVKGRDAIERDEWTIRTGSAGLTDEQAFDIKLVNVLKAIGAVPAYITSALKEAKGLTTAERNLAVCAAIADNRKHFDGVAAPWVEAAKATDVA